MKVRRARIGTPRSILVLKPSSFGDIIHTLPAVARLRAHWPESKISWLVNPEWSPLLHGNPVVDEVLIFPRQEFRGWGGLLRFHRWLHARILGLRPDLALDFQGLLRTALVGRAARAGTFAGLGDAREGARWFYDETVPVPAGVPHAVERYLALSDRIIAEAGGVERRHNIGRRRIIADENRIDGRIAPQSADDPIRQGRPHSASRKADRPGIRHLTGTAAVQFLLHGSKNRHRQRKFGVTEEQCVDRPTIVDDRAIGQKLTDKVAVGMHIGIDTVGTPFVILEEAHDGRLLGPRHRQAPGNQFLLDALEHDRISATV